MSHEKIKEVADAVNAYLRMKPDGLSDAHPAVVAVVQEIAAAVLREQKT